MVTKYHFCFLALIIWLKIRKKTYTVHHFITLRLEILPNSIQSVIVKRLVLCENPVNKSALYFVCMWPFKCNLSWHCFNITLSMYQLYVLCISTYNLSKEKWIFANFQSINSCHIVFFSTFFQLFFLLFTIFQIQGRRKI